MTATRNLLLLALALGTACAGPGRISDDEWNQIHRARLRTLHLPTADGPVDGVAAETTGGAAGDAGTPQEPVTPASQGQQPHLDDRGVPRRRAVQQGQPAWGARAGLGFGTLDVRVDGTRLADSERVATAHAVVEAVEGTGLLPGIRLEVLRGSDGLFGDELMNDGQQVRSAAARALGFDVHPYFTWRPAVGADLQLPVRVGAFVDTLQLRHVGADVQRSWFGYGGRIEIEPTWILHRDGNQRYELRGLVGGDFGGTRFRENFVGGSDEDSARRWMGELGLGLRVVEDRWSFGVDYRFRDVELGATDTELLGADRETAFRGHVLSFDLGVRF